MQQVKTSSDPFWLRQIAKHDAVVIATLADAKNHPDRAVALETRNFGWILSARDEAKGGRAVLLKY